MLVSTNFRLASVSPAEIIDSFKRQANLYSPEATLPPFCAQGPFCYPELEPHQWVSYLYPLSQIISFKRDFYRKALMDRLLGLRQIRSVAC